jgi:hypothetical protein
MALPLQCRVILLPKQGNSSFKSWEEVLDEAIDPESVEISQWHEAMVSLSERARVREKRGGEIVLCMLGDPRAESWSDGLLRTLLKNARESCWGATLFLVIHRDIRPDNLPRQQATVVNRWLQAALSGRVFDLLQLSYDPECGIVPEDSDLKRCCYEAFDRHRNLRTLSHEGLWGCSLSDSRSSFRKLLGPLACQPGGEIQAQHLILVVDRGKAEAQRRFVQQRLVEFGTRIGLIATLGNSPSEALLQICREAGLPPPLVFHAELEIWYLLLRLNEGRRSSPPEHREGHRIVPLNVAPKFQSSPGAGSLSILFTSSFVPGFDWSEQVAQAARDIGAMLEHTPVTTYCEVDPRVNPERLAEVIGEMKSPLVWVHMGHGLGEEGLEDADREPVHPERWLSCFGGWKGSLPLVLLLSCRSTPTAECFARAGAGVAIGFEGEVLSARSRILAVRVLSAALAGGGRRDPILDAFEAGLDHLKAVQNPSQPLAFYTEP